MASIGCALKSEKGQVRNTNQDACCALVAQTPLGAIGMAVVCDGVGGLSQGDLASSYVVQEMATWFTNDLPVLFRTPKEGLCELRLDMVWDELLGSLHQTLVSFGGHTQQLATTFTGLVTYRGHYLVGQVGDSRLYLVRNGRATQLTHDQTLAMQLVEAGTLGYAQAKEHPSSHVVLQAIGAGTHMHPVFASGTCYDDDLFVLCTDGVYGCLSADDIANCFVSFAPLDDSGLQEACANCVRKAMAAGSADNLSIVCMRGDPLGLADHGTLVVGDDDAW